MTTPPKPNFPIPTKFGWLLAESLEQNSWLKKIAQIAAIGAAAMGKDEGRAMDAFYKVLSKLPHGQLPRASTLATVRSALRRGGLYLLQKPPGYSPAYVEHIARHLDAATGPFVALAIGFVPPSPNLTQIHLLEFSGTLDQLGAAFTAAVDADDLEGAKHLFLGSNWLDEAYWSFPEPGQEDPRCNREALRAAANWEELTRATAPLITNTTLSWLSCLDLAVLAGGRDPAACFPLFLPLTTRFTPEALAAIHEGRPPPTDRWSDCFELPVPNLIGMLKNIVAEINQNMQKREKPPKPRCATEGAREKLSEQIKEFGRHDMLSITQFDNLLRVLTADDVHHAGEGCGFDIYALHLAANLFSLLTPRDDKVLKSESRRKRPGSITICENIPTVYERWWRRNLQDVAGNAVGHPRPEWFTRSLGERARQDRHR